MRPPFGFRPSELITSSIPASLRTGATIGSTSSDRAAPSKQGNSLPLSLDHSALRTAKLHALAPVRAHGPPRRLKCSPAYQQIGGLGQDLVPAVGADRSGRHPGIARAAEGFACNDHKPQNCGCGCTAQSFHIAWVSKRPQTKSATVAAFAESGHGGPIPKIATNTARPK
jgi:hypothetical protein